MTGNVDRWISDRFFWRGGGRHLKSREEGPAVEHGVDCIWELPQTCRLRTGDDGGHGVVRETPFVRQETQSLQLSALNHRPATLCRPPNEACLPFQSRRAQLQH